MIFSILNGLDKILYNMNSPMKIIKKLLESLERKYKIDDAGLKKFIVNKFLDFKIIDSKIIMTQVQEL